MSTKTSNSIEKYGDFIKGTCMTMCPEKERLLRERENLLHRLEKFDCHDTSMSYQSNAKGRRENRLSKADPDKIVKSFSRSAAGHQTPDPSDLRPAPVLDKTIFYLLDKIAGDCMNHNNWVERYEFVVDRLRAVRQDMVIQNLSVPESISILEPIVRFYCYSSYRLCEESMDRYDPKLNSIHLQECIKRLLVLYDSQTLTEPDSEVSRRVLRNQSEIEVLYLLLNLGNVNAITRALVRNSCNKMEQLALQLSLAWLHGNYVRACRIIQFLPILGLCVVSTHLPFLRKRALCIMNTAYSSKVLKIPMPYLRNVLKWSDTQHAVHECTHYGIAVTKTEGEVFASFLKGTFKSDVQEMSPRREDWIDDILQQSKFKDIMFPSNRE